MADISQYLAELKKQKNQLAENLAEMGVESSAAEKLNTLVPKVLEIETGVDTSDATATAEDIAVGKTAYVDGEKVTGNKEEVAQLNDDLSKEFTFAKCIKSIILPKEVTKIGSQAFKYFEGNVIVKGAIDSIAYEGFYKCTTLTDIRLSKNFKTKNASIFAGCTNLANIFYAGTEEEWNKIGGYTNWNADMGSNVTGGTQIHFNYTG